MDQTTDAGAAGTPEPAAIAMTPPVDTPEKLSPTQAGRVLRQLRNKANETEQRTETAAREDGRERPDARAPIFDGVPPPVKELALAQAGDGAAPPDLEVRGEIESADPPVRDPRSEAGTGLPSIEPPRSWTKDDKELLRASPARRRNTLPNASGHGRATFSAVRTKPPTSSRASRPRSRRWNRQGSTTSSRCRCCSRRSRPAGGRVRGHQMMADLEASPAKI